MTEPSNSIRERLRAVLASQYSAPVVVERVHCSAADLDQITAGHAPLTAEIMFGLWREFSVSPRWLILGEGDKHLPPAGFEGLARRQGDKRNAVEVYEASLRGLFRGTGESDPFALAQAMDAAKAALGAGEMTAEQNTALREALAPWLR